MFGDVFADCSISLLPTAAAVVPREEALPWPKARLSLHASLEEFRWD